MTKTIVNISPEIHQRLKKFCETNNLKMGKFVEGLIIKAITTKKTRA